jgi:hypothetical protein
MLIFNPKPYRFGFFFGYKQKPVTYEHIIVITKLCFF